MKKTLSLELLKSQTPLILPPRALMDGPTVVVAPTILFNTGGGGGGGAGGSNVLVLLF